MFEILPHPLGSVEDKDRQKTYVIWIADEWDAILMYHQQSTMPMALPSVGSLEWRYFPVRSTVYERKNEWISITCIYYIYTVFISLHSGTWHSNDDDNDDKTSMTNSPETREFPLLQNKSSFHAIMALLDDFVSLSQTQTHTRTPFFFLCVSDTA